jgi:hypothetical protein
MGALSASVSAPIAKALQPTLFGAGESEKRVCRPVHLDKSKDRIVAGQRRWRRQR